MLCLHTENYLLLIEGDLYVASTVSIGNIKGISDCIIQFIPNETMNSPGY
jgi:hypothetical protein